MSTLIKNTLYRFVTLRGPEAIEKDAVKKYFVLHPNEQEEPEGPKSTFLSNIRDENNLHANKAKLLTEIAHGLGTAFTTTDSLRQLVGDDFYNFASWLTASRASLELRDVEDKINFEHGVARHEPLISSLNAETRVLLWDNLFRQIVNFESGYVREAIISLLVADFFLLRYRGAATVEDMRTLAQARVVIPKDVFNPTSGTASSRIAFSKRTNADTLAKKSEAVLLKAQLNDIDKMLEQVSIPEKKYTVANTKSVNEYNSNFSRATDDAYKKARKVERVVVDPVSKMTHVLTEYEGLDLPVYDFKPNNELDFVIGNASPNSKLGKFLKEKRSQLAIDTIDDLKQYLNGQKEIFSSLLGGRLVAEESYVTSNGILQRMHQDLSGTFTMQVIPTPVVTANLQGKRSIKLLFEGLPNDLAITAASYYIGGSTKNYTAFLTVLPTDEDPFSINLFNLPDQYFDATGMDTFTLYGTFTAGDEQIAFSGSGTINRLQDGGDDDDTTPTPVPNPVNTNPGGGTTPGGGSGGTNPSHTFDPIYSDPEMPPTAPAGHMQPNLISAFRGISKEGYVILGSGVFQLKGTSQGDGSSNSITYIPSGFGIKRVGIADYRKVEQEVCCYVPGEVSNIENVMAREYREKSTRRLRRQEDTTTSSTESETEHLTDTSVTNRFEMNQEVSAVLSEQNSLSGGAQFTYHGTNYSASVHADFAHNTSSETSNNQAISQAKDVTERALERVVQKVRSERVTKITEEYTEDNMHGFDNRKGSQHVSGVYRWVDKVMRNKVVNYGKRLMYEFMIPEPAAFHNMAMSETKLELGGELLVRPSDPRTDALKAIADYTKVSGTLLQYWAAAYNVEVEPKPADTITVGESFKVDYQKGDTKLGRLEGDAGYGAVTIPEGYVTTKVKGIYNAVSDNVAGGGYMLSLNIGNLTTAVTGINATKTLSIESSTTDDTKKILPFKDKLPVSFTLGNYGLGDISVSATCTLGADALTAWQMKAFNTIIDAYEAKLKQYQDKLAELKQQQQENVRVNPLFYRQIENTVLRKNCIEYLASHDKLGQADLLVKGQGSKDLHVNYDSAALESYAARVKFFEQAFEWDLISYNFYPFYWADKDRWSELYKVQEDDALFKAFLQSGMARVIVTARPGFEEAVNWFMATGQIWNGGQVPTMDDPLFLSIVQELRQPEGAVEGEWESRVPTSLTIIQAGSMGLNVRDALPCDADCGDNLMFDSDGLPVLDAEGNPVKSFVITAAQIGETDTESDQGK